MALLHAAGVHLRSNIVMTQIHYFIQCYGTLDSDMQIYFVSVGSSSQGKRDSDYLRAYAADRQLYYEVRGLNNSDFVRRLIQTYNVPTSNVHQVKARELVRSLKTAVSLPLSRDAVRNAHHTRYMLDSTYRIFSNLR